MTFMLDATGVDFSFFFPPLVLHPSFSGVCMKTMVFVAPVSLETRKEMFQPATASHDTPSLSVHHIPEG